MTKETQHSTRALAKNLILGLLIVIPLGASAQVAVGAHLYVLADIIKP